MRGDSSSSSDISYLLSHSVCASKRDRNRAIVDTSLLWIHEFPLYTVLSKREDDSVKQSSSCDLVEAVRLRFSDCWPVEKSGTANRDQSDPVGPGEAMTPCWPGKILVTVLDRRRLLEKKWLVIYIGLVANITLTS